MKSHAVQALRAAILACEAYRHEIASQFCLSVTETQAISCLVNEEALTQTDLGHQLRLSPGSVTSLVDRLEAAGAATRERHHHDRRKTMVTLTDRGRGLAEESSRQLDHAFDGLPADQLPQAERLLGLIAVNLRRQTDQLAQERDAAEHRRRL